MSIAGRMKEYVTENGLKQNVIAQRANMRTDTVSMILSEKRKITVDEYVSLCIAMGVSPAMFMMIHRASSWAIGNEEAMSQAEQMLRTIDQGILNAYESKCAGKTDRQTLHDMMKNETFMTAQEAVERGFADGILWQDDDPDTRLTSSAAAMAGGMGYAMASLPPIDELKRRDGGVENTNAGEPTGTPSKGQEESKMPMTLDELMQENPELLAEIRSTAAQAERDRLKAIDDMAMTGYEDLINAAKEDPEATAESVAVQIINRQKKQGADWLRGRDDDAKNSGVNDVEGSADGNDDPDAELNGVLDEVFPKN